MGKLFYRIWKNESNVGRDNYFHLTIQVWDKDPNDIFSDCAIKLSWQGDKHSNNCWYAFKGKVESSNPDDFTRAARILRRILPKDAYCEDYSTPQTIFDHLLMFSSFGIFGVFVSYFVLPVAPSATMSRMFRQ